ncbi:hypothetical protein [Novipirellula herctigrandis]|uniref:hypothetical protein n=1 Tax=Novipirellula herctigrandis TaxID=2527986 RepID=UPI003AF33397
MARSQIWFAAPALAATIPVPNSNHAISVIGINPPAAMEAEATVVTKIIVTILGLVSWTKSIAVDLNEVGFEEEADTESPSG